jgi:hypothetical protein
MLTKISLVVILNLPSSPVWNRRPLPMIALRFLKLQKRDLNETTNLVSYGPDKISVN